MPDEIDSRRLPALDDEVDGLDCFATERVVDTADDKGVQDAVPPALPAVRSRRLAITRRLAIPPVVRKSIVAVGLLALGLLSLWMIEPPERPRTIVRDVPAPVASPRATSAPPVVQPVPAPPVARTVEQPLARATRETSRAIVPIESAPRRRVPAPAVAPSSSPAISVDASARPAVSASPAPLVEGPVVIATPEVVRAEPAVPAIAAANPVVTPPTDRSSIERLLQGYRDAYDRLDAPAAAVIWPHVDTRALNRAFSTLAEQDVSFERCDLDIAGVKASAKCTGEIRYVRRVGDQNPRVRRLSWSFALERVSDRWQIAQVTAD